MLQTLFVIPNEIGGVPLFGFGIVAALWLAWCIVYAAVRIKKEGLSNDVLGSLGVMAIILLAVIYAVPRIMVTDEATGVTGIAVRGYGVMLLLGILGGISLTVWRAKRVGVAPDLIYSLAFWVFIAGMVGARAFYVIEYWESFQRDSLKETIIAIVNMTQGGLVVFGSFIAGFIAGGAFAIKHKLPFLPLADLAAPGVMLGLALGRIGCFCNGCCFGDTCAAPWAVEFPAGSPPHVRQVETGKAFGFLLGDVVEATRSTPSPTIVHVEAGSPAERAGLTVGESLQSVDGRKVSSTSEARAAIFEAFRDGHLPLRLTTDRAARLVEPIAGVAEHSLPTHPAQIYAAIDALLCMTLLLAFGPLSRRDGETFALLLTVHPISRFLLEEIRIDEAGMFGTRLSISQHISLVMLACAAAVWIYVESRPRGHAWSAKQAATT